MAGRSAGRPPDFTVLSPAVGAEAVDISADDDTPTKPSKGLWVGGVGNVKVDLADGSTVTFTAVQAGTLLPVQVTKVYKTGTTATAMVFLW
jgi:hypothetical protein